MSTNGSKPMPATNRLQLIEAVVVRFDSAPVVAQRRRPMKVSSTSTVLQSMASQMRWNMKHAVF